MDKPVVGGVEGLNAWLAASGYSQSRMVSRGYEYRRRWLAVLNLEFATLTAEETTALQYAATDNPLFELYAPLFTGERARWVAWVRDPANRKALAAARGQLTVQDHAYWLGDMTPRETGRLLESIERGTSASVRTSATMRTILRRQQLGVRRIPHYLDDPIAHKTGDGPTIANDVGMVYARAGTTIMVFFTNDIYRQYGETEDLIGQTSRKIVDYFDRVSSGRQ